MRELWIANKIPTEGVWNQSEKLSQGMQSLEMEIPLYIQAC